MKDRVVRQVTALSAHGPQPLANTLSYAGDSGLLGPDSVSWKVIGDAAAFVGGIRALLVQAAHPEVVAGVEQHSRYRSDPLGRLSRTSAYVTETTYGAMPEFLSSLKPVGLRSVCSDSDGDEDDGDVSGVDPAVAGAAHDVRVAGCQAAGLAVVGLEDRFAREGHAAVDGVTGAHAGVVRLEKLDEAWELLVHLVDGRRSDDRLKWLQ